MIPADLPPIEVTGDACSCGHAFAEHQFTIVAVGPYPGYPDERQWCEGAGVVGGGDPVCECREFDGEGEADGC